MKLFNFTKSIFVLFLLFLSINYILANKKLVVCDSVADIRSKPKGVNLNLKIPTSYAEDPEQLSQVLFTEPLLCLDENEATDWLKVKVLEQKVYLKYQGGWQELQGYIKSDQTFEVEEFSQRNMIVKIPWTNVYLYPDEKSEILKSVCICTKLFGEKIDDVWANIKFPFEIIKDIKITEGYIPLKHIEFISKKIEKTLQQIREDLILTSLLFLENPYRWGGRSYNNPELVGQLMGSDCSGFTNLVYRLNGFQIPKNSTSQYHKSVKIDGSKVEPGDLMFFANPIDRSKTTHVMMYLGHGKIIESTGTEGIQKTRITTDIEILKNKIEAIKNGQKSGSHVIYFGTYLNCIEKIQEARDLFVK